MQSIAEAATLERRPDFCVVVPTDPEKPALVLIFGRCQRYEVVLRQGWIKRGRQFHHLDSEDWDWLRRVKPRVDSLLDARAVEHSRAGSLQRAA